MSRRHMPTARSWLALCVLVLGVWLPAHGEESKLAKVVVGAPGADAWRDLFANDQQWSDARRQINAVLIPDHHLRKFTDDELRNDFAQLRSWGVWLELEVGVIKEWSETGEGTFRIEQALWDRAWRLGGGLSSVAMDEPLIAARGLRKTDDYAVAETAAFIRAVREKYPSLAIGDIEPYPGIDLQAHKAWLAALQQRLQSFGVRGLDFYRLDIDWVAFQVTTHGSWSEVKQLADFVRQARIPLSVIYWASQYPMEARHGKADDETWYTGIMSEGYAIDELGIDPEQYVIESWISAPTRIVPDSADFSFTRSVRDFARKFAHQRSQTLPTP